MYRLILIFLKGIAGIEDESTPHLYSYDMNRLFLHDSTDHKTGMLNSIGKTNNTPIYHKNTLHLFKNVSHNDVNLHRFILINPFRQSQISPSNIQVFNKIVGNETRIRLSHYPEFLLSYDPINKYFITLKEDEAIKSEFKINKDGNSFVMKFQGSWVCYNGKLLVKCKSPSLFDIEESSFGFKIKFQGKCLSVKKSIVLLECNKTNKNQDFIFEYDRELICRDNPSLNIKKSNKKSVSNEIMKEKRDFDKKIKKYKIPDKKTKSTVWKLWSSKKRKWPSFGMC